MNILYITSEAAPFCKTGGLADVLGSLPPAVAAEGDHTAVLLPLYSQIAQRWREKMNFRCYIYVDLGWRHEYCGLFSLEYRGVTWYFADNERYFRRRGLYGDMDDGERFAFFSKRRWPCCPTWRSIPTWSTATTGRRPWCRCTCGTPETTCRWCSPSTTWSIRAGRCVVLRQYSRSAG